MKREYPQRPIPAVGAVVFKEGMVLLVKRKAEPSKGRWSIPGGAVELGETVEEALVREVLEECGVRIKPLEILDVYNNIVHGDGGIRFHYVIADFLAEYVDGTPRAGSDVEDAVWARLDELDRYSLTSLALSAIRKGVKKMESKS